MKRLWVLTFVIAVAMSTGKCFAYTVPQDDTKVEFLYVAGTKADPMKGAQDHKQELFIDVPADEQASVKIGVYDPDTGGELYSQSTGSDIDARESGYNEWDTVTVITLSGKKGVMHKKKFAQDGYNRKTYFFPQLSKTDGVKVGDYYRFTLNLTAISGDDFNLFNVVVSPDSARVSSTNISFRLLTDEGAKMYFYPLIPEGTKEIVVDNFDLDPDGGTSMLRDPADNKEYKLNDSASGEWHPTNVTLSSAKERFVEYIVTKGTQIEAQAAIRISDAAGNPIPIYFRRMAGPVSTGKCNEFTFDATSSFDPDDQALSFHWDFGDGTTSTEPIVTHRFESGGDYNVVLTVQDDSGLECDSAVSSQIVKVNSPPSATFTSPDIACTNQEVTFDASSTTDNTPDQLSYQWDFRDGTAAEGNTVTKVFEKGGKYKVRLLVNDNADTACSTDVIERVITINTNPVANAGEDIDLCLPHNQDYRISFDGSRSTDADGNALTYKWDFGDGSGETGAKVTHVYPHGGEYVATLFVDDGSGSACSSSADTVNVKINKAPVAVAGDNITVCQGTEVNFDGSGSIGEEGEELKYEWDFGDGTKENGAVVAHTYEKGGVYKAVLTVNDLQYTKCSSSSDSILVTVNSKPSAVFDTVSMAVTGDELTFDATASADPDGDDLTYLWDFGDGTDEQSGSKVTHVYNKGGNYSVRLKVNDNKGTGCSSDMTAMNVAINTPPSAVLNTVNVACTGAVVSFDATGSSDPDGDTLTYTWDFGDGTDKQTGAKVTHVYSKGGTYSVRLTVDDKKGTKRSTVMTTRNITINTPPSAVFNALKLACTGDEISFDASGSKDADGDSLSYTWNFGDGTDEKSGTNVSHVYGKGGTYSVRLTVDDKKGTECSMNMTAMNVRINTPPVANAGPNHVCCLNAVSNFDGSGSYDADGDSLTYTWNFGDGVTGNGAKVTHIYSKPGKYIVTLTVNDNSGTKCDSATASFHATVNASPTSIIKVR